MHSPPSLFCRGNENRPTSRSLRRGHLVEQDHVVALGGAAPIAVGGLRHQDVLADRDVGDARQNRPQLLLRPLLVFGQRAPVLAIAPLELIEHPLVEVRHDRLDRHARDRLRPPERRRRHRHVAVQLGPAQADFLEIDRPRRPRIAGAPELSALVDRPAGILALHLGEIAVEIIADDAVHQRQPVERVARIGDPARRIRLDAILLDIAPGQRGAAEHDRQVDPLPAHLLEVLAHHDRRFDQQPRHADRVRPVLAGGLQDRADRLLDAEIDDPVAVVGQDDVDEVLADVVHVAAHRGEHDRALLLALDPLHERFEIASPPPSSSRPIAARTAIASCRRRTARRPSSCRRADGR